MAISRIAGAQVFTPSLDRLRGESTAVSPGAPGATEGADFTQKLKDAVGQLEGTMGQASDAVAALGSGENVDIHGTMISLTESDIALRMTVSARDKFISAYEQIMNMAI